MTETSGGIDVVFSLRIYHIAADHRVNDVLLYAGAKLPRGDIVVMLGRENHRVDALRFAIHVLDAYQALGIGTQVESFAIAAHVALLADQFVRHHDGQRHQFGSFIAGVAEHQGPDRRAPPVSTPHGNVGGLAPERCSKYRRSWHRSPSWRP